MEITYVVIIAIIAYICGAITKLFIEQIPNKYIPIQNVAIGIVSALVCYFTGIETNILQAFVLCLVATMGAGGVADLINIKNKEDSMIPQYNEMYNEVLNVLNKHPATANTVIIMKIGIKTKKAVCEFDFTYGLVITLQINHQSIASTTNLYFVFVAFPFIQLEYTFFLPTTL